MKKSMIAVAVVAGLLVGCTTIGKGFDTAHALASAVPAVVEDTRNLTDKLKDLYNWVAGIWKPNPSTNAPTAK